MNITHIKLHWSLKWMKTMQSSVMAAWANCSAPACWSKVESGESESLYTGRGHLNMVRGNILKYSYSILLKFELLESTYPDPDPVCTVQYENIYSTHASSSPKTPPCSRTKTQRSRHTPEIEVRPADHRQTTALCTHCAITSYSSPVPTITSHPTNTAAVCT